MPCFSYVQSLALGALQSIAPPSVETRLIGTVDLRTARRVIALFPLLEMLFQYEIHDNSVILSTTQTAGSVLIAQDVGVGYCYGSHLVLLADGVLSNRPN